MPKTPNHEYNVPDKGAADWHTPLNENFQAHDTDIEIRDTADNRSNYTPKDGAKFLATDTGVIWIGDGSSWTPTLVLPRYQPSNPTGTIVAGHPANTVADSAVGATISGGGPNNADDLSGTRNEVFDDFGTIGGGAQNTVGDNENVSQAATVGGGANNTASGVSATVGGGDNNTASATGATVGGGGANVASADNATVGGGFANGASEGDATVGGGAFNTASARSATVGGGDNNTASGPDATVSGGNGNTANGGGATVSGGTDNTASGPDATVSGGNGNTANEPGATVGGGLNNTASATGATVGGGDSNTASGKYSFAAGRQAKAKANGAFVWADSTDGAVSSDVEDEFRVQSTGGAVFYTSEDSSTGVSVSAGEGSWSSVSARSAKRNITSINPDAVLDGVMDLEVSRWEYDTESEATHMGPMAGEFHDAFGLGRDAEHIDNVDADGVALAAIQGLAERIEDQQETITEQAEKLEEQRTELERLREERDRQAERLDALESRLETLETSQAPPSAQTGGADD